jgi:hypothetical protein
MAVDGEGFAFSSPPARGLGGEDKVNREPPPTAGPRCRQFAYAYRFHRLPSPSVATKGAAG